jgi:hypothetical protein
MKNRLLTITILILLLLLPSLNFIAISRNIEYKNNQLLQYDLLIVAPKHFIKHIDSLIIHKEKYGIKTKIVDIQDVYYEMFWKGRDDAEKLKYFIKKSIEEWNVKYVLLFGGLKNKFAVENWWIPVRYSHLDRRYSELPERKFLTDLYFADIYDIYGNFSSWDTDNDGIFGEWPEDEVAQDIPDLFPDVYVGRLPCRNKYDVKRVVKKIINYESKPKDDSWFKNMIVVAGDTYPEKTDYIDGEVYTQMGLDMMPDFNPIKLWTSDGSFRNWKDVVRNFNKGCGFIWFSGHGNPASWATHPPYDSETWLTGLKLKHMKFIRNSHKLPICISGSGCFNAMFNVSIFNSPWVYGFPITKCWAWALVNKCNGGSIATIASTAFSYESPDIDSFDGGIEWLDMNFFGEYGLNNTDVLGETWGNTISKFLHKFTINWTDDSPTGSALIAKNVQEWLLIGDPSLKIGGYN